MMLTGAPVSTRWRTCAPPMDTRANRPDAALGVTAATGMQSMPRDLLRFHRRNSSMSSSLIVVLSLCSCSTHLTVLFHLSVLSCDLPFDLNEDLRPCWLLLLLPSDLLNERLLLSDLAFAELSLPRPLDMHAALK